MSLVEFNSDNKLHRDLFENFKSDLISDIYNKDHLYCQCHDYIDELNIISRDLAVNELGLDSDISEYDSWWAAAIHNKSPKEFGIIIGIEYVDIETDRDSIEFIKASGSILVEDDKLIIWDIDACSLDYSSQKEFSVARQKY
jgi:hypothetical protein